MEFMGLNIKTHAAGIADYNHATISGADAHAKIVALQQIVDTQSEQLAIAHGSYQGLQNRVAELQEANSNLVVSKLQIAHLANHDFLTNMPNRMQLEERMRQAMALAARNKKKLAVIFLDIDHFKTINDTLGHQLGDKLIKAVAKRLADSVRNSDTVCRQGGDEFVILLPEIENAVDVICLAQKIIAALATPFSIESHQLQITVSMGISVFPDNTSNADDLIRHADTAMYCAKKNGRNQYQTFSVEIANQVLNRQSIENGLKLAVPAGEFELYYQPKVNLLNESICGVEALIRWHHPERGMLMPQDFIASAEETGFIVYLSRWVLREACTQAQAWLDAGHVFGRVSINVSPLDFHQSDFIEHIKRTLQTTGLAASMLELEITESVLVRDTAGIIRQLTELHELGVVIAIDDFGTGYSSLSYLKQLPIKVLKIDQSFLNDIASNLDGEVIVVAIINLALGLNLEVIAEGIETREQVEFLTRHHCYNGQGFLYRQPITSENFTCLLETGLKKLLPEFVL